jgi:hypothetical protein
MSFFEKFANDWEARLKAQQAALHGIIPSTQDETTARALQKVKDTQSQAHALAYKIRSATRQDPAKELLAELYGTGIPTRERSVPLPALKAASVKSAFLGDIAGAIAKPVIQSVTDPIKHGLQSARVGAAHLADKVKADQMKVTGDESTLPWYYPAMTMGSVKGFREGYAKADEDGTNAVHKDLDSKIESAKNEFERALSEEYKTRRSKHASTAGELIDGLAEKCASGELNTALGTYGAIASLLGSGAYQQAKQETEDHDPRVMKMKAVRDLIRARMRNQPLALRLEPEQEALAKTAGKWDRKISSILSAGGPAAGTMAGQLGGLRTGNSVAAGGVMNANVARPAVRAAIKGHVGDMSNDKLWNPAQTLLGAGADKLNPNRDFGSVIRAKAKAQFGDMRQNANMANDTTRNPNGPGIMTPTGYLRSQEWSKRDPRLIASYGQPLLSATPEAVKGVGEYMKPIG